MIIATTNLNEAIKQIQKIKRENKNEEIIVKAQDDDFNRKILENKNVNILLSPELHYRKEPLKQRDSGLNEILCRIAKNNKIKIGIDIDEIRKLNNKDKSKILARVIQNINLCKKTGAELILFPKNKYKKQDLMGFLQSLKSSTSQASKSILSD
jgi:RNase P/RNase MRP subunit p30